MKEGKVMDIKIIGFKNIENLEMSLDDLKINLLFGMSGSGKSSIAEALLREDLEENVTIGKNIKQEILINNATSSSNIFVFNNYTSDQFISSKDTEGMYKVLIDNQNEIKDTEDKIKLQLKELSDSLLSNKSSYDAYLNMKKDLGSSLTRDNKLKSNSKINDLKKSLKRISHSKSIKEIEKMSFDKLDWLKRGLDFLDDKNNCPFCEKTVSKKRINRIQKYAGFQSKSLQNLNDINKTYASSGLINNIDLTLESVEEFEKKLIKMIKATNDYDKLNEFINNVYNFDIANIEPIKLSKEFKELFEDTYSRAQNVFRNIRRIKGLSKASDGKAKKVLSRRLNPLNNYLDMMSIPYKIEAQYANGTITDYKIVHIADPMNEHRVKSLSFGEKNILSLLLFIYQCKTESPDLIVIDDPASSYDDFRRDQILKIIKKELKSETILVLSHDGVFAKYALSDKGLNKGKIYYYENYGYKTKLTEIDKNDFGNFDNYIVERIKTINDYYQKIINLRLLYEGGHSIVYGYLSSIVHKVSKHEIDKLLIENGTTEKEIIQTIKDKYRDLQKVTIPPYKESSVINIDTSNYSLIEKAFYLRENYKVELTKEGLIEEINDYVHINRKLRVCLNPYKFGFITKKLYDYISNKW